MIQKISQAVILAGGKGTRLYPLTLKTPKPMIKINGRPFLEYIIEELKKNDIKRVLILTGYLHNQIEKYFQNGERYGIAISYSKSPVVDGTGTRIKKALKLIDKEFLLLYCDNYWQLPLNKMISFYKKKRVDALVTVYSNFDKYTKNNMQVADNGLVEMYDKSQKASGQNGVDIGFFILKKKVLNNLPAKNFSFEEVVIPQLIAKKKLAGYITHHKYYGLSNIQRISVIEEFFKRKKNIFLDRDGTINKKTTKANYITNWDNFTFLPRVKKALQLLQKKGYTIFIITNQPGIARNMMTHEQLEIIHTKMSEELHKIGVEIKEVFVCKHGWDDGCFCRKPNPGMFFQAASKYNINLFESYCIGDDERDIIAGKTAGCKTFLITKSHDLYYFVNKYL